MLKFLKRIFRRDGAAATAPVAAAPVAVQRAAEKSIGSGVEVASLSLRAILEKLPPELHAIINQLPEPGVKIMLPVNTILKQLPTGAVRMSLASLLRQAPAGTFRKTQVEERQMVDVPLSEVFKNVDARRLGRRNDQRQYNVPEDAAGLFGTNGSNRSVTGGASAEAGGQHPATALPTAPAATAPSTPQAGPAAIPQVTPPRVVRMPGIPPPEPAPVNGNGSGNAHAPSPAATMVPKPKATQPGGGNGELVISFVELAAAWPEGIRCELSCVPGDTKLVIPAQAVGAGLQKGKVAFPWSQVRMWMRPVLNASAAIAEDVELVFPLKIVAPAFVAATGATKHREAADIDHSMPDFFGPAAGQNAKPEPSATSATVAATPVEAALPVISPPADPVLPAPEPAAAPLKFTLIREAPLVISESVPEAVPIAGPGVKSTLSPAEIVQRACAIQGVKGALIALEEGLVVAQNLPPGFSADTFAAFMPQIFGRLEKYTAEMQLGTATEITIHSEHGPCHIARRGKIYFGTLGSAGERLPDSLGNLTAQLASLNS